VHRRIAATAALVAVLALALPTAALAAGATLRGPTDGVVSGPTSLDVRIHREPFEAISAIDVTLRRGAAPLQGSRAHPLCEGLRDCPNGQREADYRIPFDPRDGSPFLTNGGRVLANGAYELVVAIQVGRETQQRALPVTISVPPAAPGDVRARASGQDVTVQWRAGAEPDLAGFRVERSSGNGWTRAGEVDGAATSYVDRPGPGDHRYRVVVIRPDGRGGSYEVTSSEASVSVAAPAPADEAGGGSGADQADDRDTGGDDGEATGARAGDDRRREAPADDATFDVESRDRDEADTDAAGATPTAGTSGRRSFEAPSVNLRRDEADTPGLPADDPDFFRETLDYGDAEAVASGQRGQGGDRGEVLLSVPGMGALTGGMDDSRFAVPIAGGLLMTAIGLHLWRWLKLPVT
jgi:hypothetical protein